jgi:hypothetical protein
MNTPSPASPTLRIRVFLASPGDVTDERALALRVLERLPYDLCLPKTQSGVGSRVRRETGVSGAEAKVFGW